MSRTWTPQEIRDLLDRKDWTQRHLADLIPVTPATLNRWVNGHRRPSPVCRARLDQVAVKKH
jgi:transcriptional regulator with XRE-family HTH domain